MNESETVQEAEATPEVETTEVAQEEPQLTPEDEAKIKKAQAKWARRAQRGQNNLSKYAQSRITSGPNE